MYQPTSKVVLITGASSGIADAIAYAITQPPNVDVSEIVIRPTAQS
jgi:NADP-dependent 3-hydroxy acid dehydrogenase YdfG